MNGIAPFRSAYMAELASRQMTTGGWAYFHNSRQASIEATSLALLAAQDNEVLERGVAYLLTAQNPNGSWPAFAGDDQDGSWATALVVMALRGSLIAAEARLKGARWLLSTAGRESHWLWSWKFRLFDRHVQFDPRKYGWPWIPDTNSWVVPTAFSILALRGLPCDCGLPDYSLRLSLGISMLHDRSCPGGGWNSGNGLIYGSALGPHADDTAVALLALTNEHDDAIVQACVHWLEVTARGLPASASLALSIIALALHRRSVADLLDRLLSVSPSSFRNAATLAWVLLASDAAQGSNVAEVTP